MLERRLKDVPVFSGISRKDLAVAQQTDGIDVPLDRTTPGVHGFVAKAIAGRQVGMT